MRFSRRSLLLAGAAPLLAAKKATAFALIGDRYHNSDYIRTALTRTIVKEAGVSVDFSDETRLISDETLKGYRLLIILRDGMIWPDGYPDETSNAAWVATGKPELKSDPPMPAGPKPQPKGWIAPEQGKAIRRFVESGGSALFLHNVTNVGNFSEDFAFTLGAIYAGHPPIRTFKVKVTNSDHPITKGVKDFIVTDEQHYMNYSKDDKYVFLKSVNEENLDYRGMGPTANAGWAFDLGKGRVCYMSPGHLLNVLWNPEYIKLQKNAVRWLLRDNVS